MTTNISIIPRDGPLAFVCTDFGHGNEGNRLTDERLLVLIAVFKGCVYAIPDSSSCGHEMSSGTVWTVTSRSHKIGPFNEEK